MRFARPVAIGIAFARLVGGRVTGSKKLRAASELGDWLT